MSESFQYPIGRFIEPEFIDHGLIRSGINDIEIFPSRLKTEVGYLSSDQLDTPYRPEGWTVRQVVHHCADSHINSFIRFKLTLTEDKPVIKPYFEYLWADLADSKMEIEPSLLLLEALHKLSYCLFLIQLQPPLLQSDNLPATEHAAGLP